MTYPSAGAIQQDEHASNWHISVYPNYNYLRKDAQSLLLSRPLYASTLLI